MRVKTRPDLFSATREEWVTKAQKIAQELLLKRDHITIEDVTAIHKLPAYLSKNVIGAVFKNPIFRPIGFTVARRPAARGHVIRIWTLNEAYYDAGSLKRFKTGAEYGDVA